MSSVSDDTPGPAIGQVGHELEAVGMPGHEVQEQPHVRVSRQKPVGQFGRGRDVRVRDGIVEVRPRQVRLAPRASDH